MIFISNTTLPSLLDYYTSLDGNTEEDFDTYLAQLNDPQVILDYSEKPDPTHVVIGANEMLPMLYCHDLEEAIKNGDDCFEGNYYICYLD